MRPARFLTITGALCLIMAGSTSAAFASTVSPCGADGTAGPASCTYTTVGPATFTVPAGVHSAEFTVDGAQAGVPGSQVGVRVNVAPGETFDINVGRAADSSDVTTGSGSQVVAATGNGQVTVAWTPPVAVPSPPAISIPGLDLNLGALLSGVGGLLANLLG